MSKVAFQNVGWPWLPRIWSLMGLKFVRCLMRVGLLHRYGRLRIREGDPMDRLPYWLLQGRPVSCLNPIETRLVPRGGPVKASFERSVP